MSHNKARRMFSTKPVYQAATRVGGAAKEEKEEEKKKKKKTTPYFLLNGKRVVPIGPVVPFGMVRRAKDKRWVSAGSPQGELRLVYNATTTCAEMTRFLAGIMAGGPTYRTVAAGLTAADATQVKINVHISNYVRWFDASGQELSRVDVVAFKIGEATKAKDGGILISGQVVVAPNVAPVFVNGSMRVSKADLARHAGHGHKLQCLLKVMERWMCELDRQKLARAFVASR